MGVIVCLVVSLLFTTIKHLSGVCQDASQADESSPAGGVRPTLTEDGGQAEGREGVEPGAGQLSDNVETATEQSTAEATQLNLTVPGQEEGLKVGIAGGGKGRGGGRWQGGRDLSDNVETATEQSTAEATQLNLTVPGQEDGLKVGRGGEVGGGEGTGGREGEICVTTWRQQQSKVQQREPS